MYSREMWEPRNPELSGLEARLPSETKRIIFHHSAEKFDRTEFVNVATEIRRIQNQHMDDESYADIGYHFIIDPAGNIWEARDTIYKGSHAYGYNNDIGVLILGDYEPRWLNNYTPNELNQAQKDAMIVLSKWLCYEYKLSIIPSGSDVAPISTHRTVNNDTVCPGDNAADWVETELRQIINEWGY